MPSKSIITLNQDIRKVLQDAQKGQDPTKANNFLTPEALSAFGVSCAVAVDRQLHRPPKVRDPNVIYASELGIPCDRKIWYKHHSEPSDKALLPPNVLTKFMYGDLVESLTLAIVEAAGHTVTHRQHPVIQEFNVGGEIWTVRGKIDAVVDESTVVDVKSTTTYGYNDFLAGKGGAKFGYAEQLGYYSTYIDVALHTVLDDSPRAGFIAVDRSLGHISFVPEDNLVGGYIQSLVESQVHTVHDDINSIRALPTEPHTDGNYKLCVECSYCEYKKECWKDANGGKGIRSFLYSGGKVIDLVEIGKEPRVKELIAPEIESE